MLYKSPFEYFINLSSSVHIIYIFLNNANGMHRMIQLTSKDLFKKTYFLMKLHVH
jgi:hypothetical protein